MNDDADDYGDSVDKAEAWDAIAAKNAELTRLREQLDRALALVEKEQDRSNRLIDELAEVRGQRDAARVEVNRALTEIADNCDRAARHEVGRESAMLAAHAAWFRALIPQPAPTISPAEAAKVLLDDLALALEPDLALQGGKEAGRRWSTAHDAADSAPTALSRPTPIQMMRAALRAIAEDRP